MLTVPLQGCRELKSPSFPAASPDSKLLSSLSLVTSASRAERFSPATNIPFASKSNKQRDNKKRRYNAVHSGFGTKCKRDHFIVYICKVNMILYYWTQTRDCLSKKKMHVQETSSSFSASASSSEPRPCSSSVQQLRACSVWLITVCSFPASSLSA